MSSSEVIRQEKNHVKITLKNELKPLIMYRTGHSFPTHCCRLMSVCKSWCIWKYIVHDKIHMQNISLWKAIKLSLFSCSLYVSLVRQGKEVGHTGGAQLLIHGRSAPGCHRATMLATCLQPAAMERQLPEHSQPLLITRDQ